MATSDSKRGWRFIDLTGQTFGRLTVLELAARHPKQGLLWHCRCSCGAHLLVMSVSLRSGNTRSCGCLSREGAAQRATARNFKHGATTGGAPFWHQRWAAMMARCHDPANKRYPRYGGRGIVVCDRWHDPVNFHADMGDPPPGHTLDRIDNDGPYSPENCRWADAITQARNRSNVRQITYNGVTLTMQEWANKIGIDQSTLNRRLTRWGVERALDTPPYRAGR